MIELYTGLPRSGKTYLVVNTLANEYFTFNKEMETWVKKKDKKDITLITNIKGLSLPHVNLDDALESAKVSPAKFFTVDFQNKIKVKYPKIVYAIDECQFYFPDIFKDIDTRYYFETHGHFGHQIYLITQDRFRACRAIVSLSEIEVRAVKRSLSMMGEFKYNILSDGEIIDRKVLKPSKKIFNIYRSQEALEHKKPKKLVVKYILAPLILLIVSAVCLYNVVKPKAVTASNTVQPPGPVEQTDKKQAVFVSKDTNNMVWVTLQGVIRMNGAVYMVIDPVSGELCRMVELPYQLRTVGRKVQVQLPAELVPKKEETGGDPPLSAAGSAERM